MPYGDYYSPTNKVVVPGAIVYADDLNKINLSTDAGFAQVAADLDSLAAAGVVAEAKAWATADAGARPDALTDDYSSKAYAKEAQGWASSDTTIISAKTGIAVPGALSAKKYSETSSAQAEIAREYAEAANAVVTVTPWVSGTTYTAGATRWSLINFQTYRRKTDGAGTTDPSLDSANWALLSITSLNDATVNSAMFRDVGYVFVDKGDSGTTAQVVDFSAGTHQRIRATGSFTLSFTNWAPAGNFSEVLLELTADGTARTITFPVGTKFLKFDGSVTTTFSETMVTLQSAAGAIDWLLFWTRDAGTTLYCKVVR